MIEIISDSRLEVSKDPFFSAIFASETMIDKMNLQPKIESVTGIKLVGKRIRMSLANNKTKELWQSFMPKLKEIKNNIGTELYSVEVYNNPLFFEQFNPSNEFEKWAAIQVSNFEFIPEGMDKLEIQEGKYAVFIYRGKASGVPQFYQYILGEWIPKSEYELDNRPHFAVMGEKYKNEDPDSEEELWIPITKEFN